MTASSGDLFFGRATSTAFNPHCPETGANKRAKVREFCTILAATSSTKVSGLIKWVPTAENSRFPTSSRVCFREASLSYGVYVE